MAMTSQKRSGADFVSVADLIDDPLPVYERLRSEYGDVVWVPAQNRYFFLGYAVCRFAEENSETFAPLTTSGLPQRAIGPSMLSKVGPAHDVERTSINPPLRPRAIAHDWLSVFRANAERHLARLVTAGPGADLVRDFAIPYTADNLAAIAGIPEAGWEAVHRWSAAFIAGSGNVLDAAEVWEACERANAEADAVIAGAITRVRAQPDASIVSALVHAPVALVEELVYANMKLAVGGGVNEPQHALVGGVWAFAQHADQHERLLADPTLFANAFDEAVRWLSPIQALPRIVTAPVEVAGVSLVPGDEISIVIAAANRDPGHFARPHEFDAFRERRPHLAFGAGIHACAGSRAARAQVGQVAWPLLYERLAGLRPVDPNAARFRGFTFRGIEHLPVTWDHVRGGTL
jgi:cytochrome P450